MKIQCEANHIRMRLDENEYKQLRVTGQLISELTYLRLQITVQLVSIELPARLQNQQLIVNLTSQQLKNLIEPTVRKEGINLWLNTHDNLDLLFTIQLDLMK